MRTWIVGDSIIRRAGNRNTQLHGAGETLWDGKPGGQLLHLISRVRWLLGHNQFPTTIVVHMGTNDIFKASLGEIRASITENLKTIRQLLPFVRIIWSDILFRLGYSLQKKKGAGVRSTKNLNQHAHKVCREMLGGNAHVIRYSEVFHPSLNNVDDNGPIYGYDCTHPTERGLLIIRQQIANALVVFNNQPRTFAYPPGSENEDN